MEDESSISVGSTGTLMALMGKEMQIMQARKSFSHSEYMQYTCRYYSCSSCSKSPSSSSSSCQLDAGRRHSLAGPARQLAHPSSGHLSRTAGHDHIHVAPKAARHVRPPTSSPNREESAIARSITRRDHVGTSASPVDRQVSPDRSRANSAPTGPRHVSTSPPPADGHVSPGRSRASSAASNGPIVAGRSHVSSGVRRRDSHHPRGQGSPSLVSSDISPSPGSDTSKRKKKSKKKKKKGPVAITHDDDDDHSDTFAPMLTSKMVDRPHDNDNNASPADDPTPLLERLKFRCKSARSLSFVHVVDLKVCCPQRTLMNGVLGCTTKQRSFSRLL